ncbi:MAG: hypothetical protein DKM50_00665 [Candidatus Margulisiibacteriota bacterium]|nr:MAG: hypothetical protein DKM50_00665 [Candidatus Margulisiibacteriota bacterium]HAR63289.1 hypothetical protein [Candidatus Margulisiibacteriota bacterium]HCT85212.1 hypothetical protein [Candidatus Margulisiibacteriota bacterium]HCY36358.1 hypothetical protein [Candidatus Margulisiibacteriota bacterium]
MNNACALPIKRILMTGEITSTIWTYMMELIKALDEYNIEVVLAAMGGLLPDEQKEEIKKLANIKVYESNFKLEWMEKPWKDLEKAGKWLLMLEKLTKPDIIHCNSYVYGALPWHNPVVLVGHPYVLHQLALQADVTKEHEKYYQHVQSSLDKAASIVVPTKQLLFMLEKKFGQLSRARIIRYSRNPSLFPLGKKNPFIFSSEETWNDIPSIETLNNIAPSLNWPIYIAKNSDVPGEKPNPYRNLLILDRLSSKLARSWLTSAAIYVLPSGNESFGFSVLEAALSGCVLVLGDTPSLRELWGDCAVYVARNDEEGLKTTLKFLITSRDFCQNIAARSHKQALEYIPKNMAKSYISLYQELNIARYQKSTLTIKQDTPQKYCVTQQATCLSA